MRPIQYRHASVQAEPQQVPHVHDQAPPGTVERGKRPPYLFLGIVPSTRRRGSLIMSEFSREHVVASLLSTHGEVLQRGKPVVISRAPARLDVMGGIADYSGAIVLEGTLAEATICGVQLRDDQTVRIVSSANDPHGGAERDVTVPLNVLFPARTGSPFARVRSEFPKSSPRHWASYGLGAYTVLMAEHVVGSFPCGATIVVHSNVPLGAGVSSSAALEVAVMKALSHSYGFPMAGIPLASLCQKVENYVVGAPCGIMDQVTSVLGREDEFLCLKCQPHDVQGFVRLPKGVRVVGLNSDVKHSVGGERYTSARVGAFMGQRIIQEVGLREAGVDPTGGYLANISVADFRKKWARHLPPKMAGAEFLESYHRTNDPVAPVAPQTEYMVRSRAAHPVYENDRVQRFISLMKTATDSGEKAPLIAAGKLMYASHWSYGQRCGLGSRETNTLVSLVRQRGVSEGFFGAKITGGGSGGTVAILCRRDTDTALESIAERYHEISGRSPQLFLRSGPGADQWGVIQASF